MSGSSSIPERINAVPAGPVPNIDPIFELLRTSRAQNITYAHIRSILFIPSPELDEIFDLAHDKVHGDEQKKKNLGIRNPTHELVPYWGDRVNHCPVSCALVCVLLAENWRKNGRRLTQDRTNLLLNFGSIKLLIMSKLYESVEFAYKRLERQTKDALLGRGNGEELNDAARCLLGGNFTVAQDPTRLQKLLDLLQESSVHQLLVSLAAKKHLEETVEEDKRALAALKLAKKVEESIKASEEKLESHLDAPAEKGKNYKKNKRTAERRKNARKAEVINQEAAASHDHPGSEEMVDNTATSATQPDEHKEATASLTPLEPPPQIEGGAPNDLILNPDHLPLNAATSNSIADLIAALSSCISEDPSLPTASQSSEISIEVPSTSDVSHPVLESESFTDLNITPSSIENQEPFDIPTLSLPRPVEDRHASVPATGAPEVGLTNGEDNGWKQVQGKRKKSSKNDKAVEVSLNNANAWSSGSGTSRVGVPSTNHSTRTPAPAPKEQTSTNRVTAAAAILATNAPAATLPAAVAPVKNIPTATIPIATVPAAATSKKSSDASEIVRAFIAEEYPLPSTSSTTPKKKSNASDNKSAISKSDPKADIKNSIAKASPAPEPSLEKEESSMPFEHENPVSMEPITAKSELVEELSIKPEAIEATEPQFTKSDAIIAVEAAEPHITESEATKAIKAVETIEPDFVKPNADESKVKIDNNVLITEPKPNIPKTPNLNIDKSEPAEITPADSKPAKTAEPEPLGRDLIAPEIAADSVLSKAPEPEPSKPETAPVNSVSAEHVDPERLDLDPAVTKTQESESDISLDSTHPATQSTSAASSTNEPAPSEPATREPTPTLADSLRSAGVQESALASLLPNTSATQPTAALLPLATPFHPSSSESTPPGQINLGTARQLVFGTHLNSRNPNGLNRICSADNSPVPRQLATFPTHGSPGVDILTAENQEIWDRITRGEYPVRQPKAEGVPEVEYVFATKPIVFTYDGKDAYEVLGDRCPKPLTLATHPNLNKCVQEGHSFNCTFCKVTIPATIDTGGPVICPGCGPCSEVRYCNKSHLLADILDHYYVCGTQPGNYPLDWDQLPRHLALQYPYIKSLDYKMPKECFRQVAFCLNIESDGVIEAPCKSYYKAKYSAQKQDAYEKLFTKDMYPFQDQGHYYLFTDQFEFAVDMAICMPAPTADTFREDERFLRIRNACFLTRHPKLVAVLYRRLADIIQGFPEKEKVPGLMAKLEAQLRSEFPVFNPSSTVPAGPSYEFEKDWRRVRFLVYDLELCYPILRSWILKDAEDPGIPEDPRDRYVGSHWDTVVGGPTFTKGDVNDWGRGWVGIDEEESKRQLNRKYYYMVLDELMELETEKDGQMV